MKKDTKSKLVDSAASADCSEPSGTDHANVEKEIAQLEEKFRLLHRRLITEIKASAIDARDLIESLVMLPIRLRHQYAEKIEKIVQACETDDLNRILLRLSPLFTFIDYHLLQHLIMIYGNEALRQDMKSYDSDVQEFMEQTTVAELINLWPGLPEFAPKLSQQMNKFSDDFNLHRVDIVRRRFCPKFLLSEVIGSLAALDPSK